MKENIPQRNWIAFGLPFVTGSILLIGEMLGEHSLSIVHNYISEFAARLDPSGAFVRAAMWMFGLSYLATASVLLRWRSESGWIRWGCLCLAAAASLLPFVAEYRIIVPHKQGFWSGLADLLLRRNSIPLDLLVSQEVHGNAIYASMLWVMGGMILIGMGAWRSKSGGNLSKWSWLSAIAAFLLFQGCHYLTRIGGLVELLAFGCIATWLIVAIRAATDFTADRKAGSHEPDPS